VVAAHVQKRRFEQFSNFFPVEKIVLVGIVVLENIVDCLLYFSLVVPQLVIFLVSFVLCVLGVQGRKRTLVLRSSYGLWTTSGRRKSVHRTYSYLWLLLLLVSILWFGSIAVHLLILYTFYTQRI